MSKYLSSVIIFLAEKTELNQNFEARSLALDRDYSPDRLPLRSQLNFRMYKNAVETYIHSARVIIQLGRTECVPGNDELS